MLIVPQVHLEDTIEYKIRNKYAGLTQLQIGTAAEHLVCADLILQNYNAFLTDQNCAYDVVADCDDKLIRIQVKATQAPKMIPQRKSYIPGYFWHVKRAGKGGNRHYGANEFDLLALVALDIRVIAYLPIKNVVTQTITLHPPHSTQVKHRVTNNIDLHSFERALELL